MRASMAAILLAGLAACTPERIRARPADGGQGSALYYELDGEGYDWGDVKVWAPVGTDALEARFRIRNDGDQVLRFEAKDAYAELGVGGRFERLSPEAVKTDVVEVAPGSTEHVSLMFRLPEGTALDDVEEFEVNWAVQTPKGRVTRSSAFLVVHEPDEAYYRPYGYPYGSSRYWYDPWYW